MEVKIQIPDITDPNGDVIQVDFHTDCVIQRGMIEVHRYYLGIELGRQPNDLETMHSWVDRGFAQMYRDHVQRVVDIQNNN